MRPSRTQIIPSLLTRTMLMKLCVMMIIPPSNNLVTTNSTFSTFEDCARSGAAWTELIVKTATPSSFNQIDTQHVLGGNGTPIAETKTGSSTPKDVTIPKGGATRISCTKWFLYERDHPYCQPQHTNKETQRDSLSLSETPAMAVTSHVASSRLILATAAAAAAAQQLYNRRSKLMVIDPLNVRTYSTRGILFRTSPSSSSRLRNSRDRDAETSDLAPSRDASEAEDTVAGQIFMDQEARTTDTGISLMAKLAIGLGIAATITLISIVLKLPVYSSSGGFSLADDSASSLLSGPSVGFTFNVFGYAVVLPQYAPGWVYFWLLMAAGCGLFISEEALNIWVGISLARLLSLDGTWSSFSESFSKNAPYIISTVLWVYWGVCISDMVPFYLGKLFRRTGASNDVFSKLGIGKAKATEITHIVQRSGNLIGFVERFSLGVRNPTSFLAGALDISPEYFFAGVCCGGLVTLPLQLGIGFLLRERPVFAIATAATVVGVWTLFPYAIAASTALFLYMRSRLSS